MTTTADEHALLTDRVAHCHTQADTMLALGYPDAAADWNTWADEAQHQLDEATSNAPWTWRYRLEVAGALIAAETLFAGVLWAVTLR